MASGRARTAFLGLLIAVGGCGDDENSRPALAPGGGSRGISSPTGGDDDGGTGDDGGADPSKGLLKECEEFAPAQFFGEDTPIGELNTYTLAPSDFAVTRSKTTWEGKCPDKTIVVYLSDGECQDGDGHELELRFSSSAVMEGAVHGGENAVLAEPDDVGIKVRYRRPGDLDPGGEWGTCKGASGQIAFQEPPELGPRSRWQATYQLQLAPCDGNAANTIIQVNGGFNVVQRRPLSDVCPPVKDAP